MGITLGIQELREKTGRATAFRRLARLQPAGGAGDKVFPPTYEGAEYALEERVIDGRRVPCALLDSVQSQANRMELALLAAVRADRIGIPVIEVDFGAKGLPEVGTITSLEAPHRIADAIIRDSVDPGSGKPFRTTSAGQVLDTASLGNATGLFEVCPTALLFGLWDSTGPRGGLGAKFQRTLVSELVGVNAALGVRPSSRIDPLGIQLNAGPLYETSDGGWTLDEGSARREKDKPVKVGKDGKPSEANHGNITPSLKSDAGEPNHGGVTLDHALQTSVLSLPALRRLSFPLNGKRDPEADLAARTVLAALGLCAATLWFEQGCDLRSRCLLAPEPGEPPTWEVVEASGETVSFALDGDGACTLLVNAIADAKKTGLNWHDEPIRLVPSDGLAALVGKSRALAMQTTAGS